MSVRNREASHLALLVTTLLQEVARIRQPFAHLIDLVASDNTPIRSIFLETLGPRLIILNKTSTSMRTLKTLIRLTGATMTVMYQGKHRF